MTEGASSARTAMTCDRRGRRREGMSNMKDCRYKWLALALLWVTYFLLQGTRQIYGATLPQIKADFGVDDVRMGVVASVFFMGYAVAVPFAGFAADFLRRKWVIVAGTALFAAGVFFASFASMYASARLLSLIVKGSLRTTSSRNLAMCVVTFSFFFAALFSHFTRAFASRLIVAATLSIA